ncbi:MAG: prepilin-type N-terminal cleavage/methylation domain-containing protein [Candidatus Aminicenantes bacterium]|nr:prepilin-type N-terminal cleavage/methylation domain-containing protein [Candidatus Aminicenantes bacterium]
MIEKKRFKGQEGVTLLETLVVLALLGMVLAWSFPSILNTLETRNLENAAREVLTTLQRAKYLAVEDKEPYRVRFFNDNGPWQYVIETENSPGNWITTPGFVPKTISAKFNVTVSLPSDIITISSMGLITDFDTNQNSITLQSPKLDNFNQPDLRIVSVFAGGSIRYEESQSEE